MYRIYYNKKTALTIKKSYSNDLINKVVI